MSKKVESVESVFVILVDDSHQPIRNNPRKVRAYTTENRAKAYATKYDEVVEFKRVEK